MKVIYGSVIVLALSFAAGPASAAWCGLDTSRPWNCDQGYTEVKGGGDGSSGGSGGGSGGGGGGSGGGGGEGGGGGSGGGGEGGNDNGRHDHGKGDHSAGKGQGDHK